MILEGQVGHILGSIISGTNWDIAQRVPALWFWSRSISGHLGKILLAICLILEFWKYHLILLQDEIHRILSSDTPDQITQFTSLDPSLARSSASNTPSLTNLSDNFTGLTANDTTHRDHHIGRHHRIGKNLAVVFDDAKGAEYGIGADVDV